MTRLHGRVAVVTGAGKGMGRTHCERLADEGADIVAIDLPGTSELADTVKEVEYRGRRCVPGFADVRDPEALTQAVDVGVQVLGRLDVVVANAGIYEGLAPSWELTEDAWRRALDVNLTGVLHTVKAGLPHLTNGGSVVIISSTNGLKGTANTTHYTASKHAVVGLARTAANELGPLGIRVNTVHPGAVNTGMILNPEVIARLRPDLENPTESDAAEALAARTLLPVPWVEAVDISNAVVFLASDEARYITGTQLVVDAGLTQKA
ncbi:mycofactocin-coupled SDR family oxidoreductase [Mycobacterium sp. CBMA271]|uniref:mycofactocin-coupled SDR family oxidoreductase n=1 Tax=unclassified Mycobacteroides TaxID=2618759 RepID=UPI0012DE2827|nr:MULTISPECIES: mycofactocin-coupled SDR family oxidoreductase [unclassified Mycobacteroides]MUM18112.1 3-ketoacyl-ACP reductase [Mycobacteroides sp. CBMA 326]MUM23403.1 mycofactocin-coupled SDR family oxidoreductase [Mycobacteroides sp. CBMA 271]